MSATKTPSARLAERCFDSFSRVRHLLQRRLELWPIREAIAIVASPALELGLCHRQSIGHLNDLERVGVAANDERDPGAVVPGDQYWHAFCSAARRAASRAPSSAAARIRRSSAVVSDPYSTPASETPSSVDVGSPVSRCSTVTPSLLAMRRWFHLNQPRYARSDSGAVMAFLQRLWAADGDFRLG
jgi:hypothetical protein